MPVSTRELLDCLQLFEQRLLFANLEDFYFLSRMTLVKDEKYYDRFDKAFDNFFSGLGEVDGLFEPPENMQLLEHFMANYLPGLDEAEQRQLIEAYYLERQNQVEEDRQAKDQSDEQPASDALSEHSNSDRQKDAAEENALSDQSDETGESDDSGDSGDSGESGEEGEKGEEGEEGEDGESGNRGEGDDGEQGLGESEDGIEGEKETFEREPKGRATKVWQLRQYADYDPDVELGTRNIKMALRRLRKFARTSPELELDLPNTIRSTARNGGLLDIIEVPERRNSVKVLLFLDVGGSMDEHISLCAQLFSAARSEFKYLEYYYFHNFLYESVWPDNERRGEDRLPTFDVIRKFGSDYKIIFVGDANMARHEITERGGSVERFNGEPGQVWLQRVQDHFKKVIWLNPVAEDRWSNAPSTMLIKRLVEDQMYHLSVTGIEQAMKTLAR